MMFICEFAPFKEEYDTGNLRINSTWNPKSLTYFKTTMKWSNISIFNYQTLQQKLLTALFSFNDGNKPRAKVHDILMWLEIWQ